MITLDVPTQAKSELVDITAQVAQALRQSGISEGVCHVVVPHTTAGITLNENWDPTVRQDMLLTMDDHLVPPDPRHRHGEGNSPAHIKATLCGVSTTVIVSDGQLQLGRWQGIYLAEFDGPRRRRVWVKVMAG
ncbi:MAG TPA: secondary thiamine-phosphate synthase enzyme YjbQ [Anaerolineae bacterium]|jgi:secondary thiamine-phosphate synthase enzyme|nr:secondary thiamine-phosphate synthase enzyme YjbQ [Anaerolineae bacterium]